MIIFLLLVALISIRSCVSTPDTSSCSGSNARLVDGTCFRLFDDKATWKEAKQSCEDKEYVLAKVTSKDQARQIFDTDRLTDQVWIGASDSESEGTFRWVATNNTANELQDLWAKGEPNNLIKGTNDEDCVILWQNFVALDEFCLGKRSYLCMDKERDPSMESNYLKTLIEELLGNVSSNKKDCDTGLENLQRRSESTEQRLSSQITELQNLINKNREDCNSQVQNVRESFEVKFDLLSNQFTTDAQGQSGRIDKIEQNYNQTQLDPKQPSVAGLQWEKGVIDFAHNDFVNKKGNRGFVQEISFKNDYTVPPVVVISVSKLDLDIKRNLRYEVSVTETSTKSFKIRFFTWWDTQIYSISVNWWALNI